MGTERSAMNINGTINAAGTLSGEINLRGVEFVGLIYTGATNGTMTFQVASKPDADGGTYYDLKGTDGAAVAVGPTAASGAISGAVLQALAPYRYAKVKMSVAQTTGVALVLAVKI